MGLHRLALNSFLCQLVQVNSLHVLNAKVVHELHVALRNVCEQLNKLSFVYLSRVKQSLDALREFAFEHFFVDETVKSDPSLWPKLPKNTFFDFVVTKGNKTNYIATSG